jgi:hypothetical protein
MDSPTERSRLPWLPILGVAVSCLAATPAGAHDLWIVPSTFHPQSGELVRIGLRVGEPDTGGEPVPRDERFLERFVLLGPDGETRVPGLDGREPAGWIRPETPGRYVLALRSHEAVNVLPGREFEEYLEEKGLDGVIARRAGRGETDAPGRERYSRALKALLAVEGSPGAADGGARLDPDRPLGLRLEMILLDDPGAWRAGAPISVELRFEDRPLAGALVEAHPLGGSVPASAGRSEPARRARTDRRGRVSFELPTAGAWVLTAVHMMPAPAGAEEDWQSLWTALSFSLGPS